jgi:hypothetical protein
VVVAVEQALTTEKVVEAVEQQVQVAEQVQLVDLAVPAQVGHKQLVILLTFQEYKNEYTN